jgi:predicted nucleic acid-binding protein
MVEVLSDAPISIEDVISENTEVLEQVRVGVRDGLEKFARELPPGFHEEMRQGLLEVIIEANGVKRSPLKVRLVIDSNIIIAEAFRVGKGIPSTTERVLRSPFVEVYAPRIVWEEVEHVVRRDLPKGASLERALAHAHVLLGLVKDVSQVASWALERARAAIAAHSPEDVPVLAVAIESGADAVVSRDRRAFDAQREAKRWDFGKGVEVISSYETGSLSLAIAGVTAELLSEALQRLGVWLAAALEELLEIAAAFLGGLAAGLANAISRIPEWAVWVILGAGAVAALAFIFHEGFRNWALDGLAKLGEALKPIVAALVESSKRLWAAVRVVLIVAWNLVVFVTPFIMAAGGVILHHARQLFEMIETEEARRGSPTAS